jgi:hypothetical protein
MSSATSITETGMSQQQAAILDFEKNWWSLSGSKESEIRERFDLSPTRYYQLLNALIDTPEALQHEPLLVKRLLRQRAARQRERTAKRLGVGLSS